MLEKTTQKTGKILIVEDDTITVKILKSVFELRDYQIFIAHDGQEALEKINQETPDLIILYLGLPKLSGECVCKTIKSNDALKKIPIIILSSKCSDADKIIGRVIGADYYITKPLNMMKLLCTASDIIEKKNLKGY